MIFVLIFEFLRWSSVSASRYQRDREQQWTNFTPAAGVQLFFRFKWNSIRMFRTIVETVCRPLSRPMNNQCGPDYSDWGAKSWIQGLFWIFGHSCKPKMTKCAEVKFYANLSKLFCNNCVLLQCVIADALGCQVCPCIDCREIIFVEANAAWKRTSTRGRGAVRGVRTKRGRGRSLKREVADERSSHVFCNNNPSWFL